MDSRTKNQLVSKWHRISEILEIGLLELEKFQENWSELQLRGLQLEDINLIIKVKGMKKKIPLKLYNNEARISLLSKYRFLLNIII